MIRKKLLAVPLCLALLLTTLLPVYLPGAAEGFVKRAGILFEPKELPTGVKVTKTVSPEPDYKVKIEAYVTTTGTLDSTSEIRDVVSTYFDPPKSADEIHLSTVPGDTLPTSVNATVESNTVSVTGFNFETNKKLIIEYNITPKTGFLGGNGVPADMKSGIYNGDTLVGNFTAAVDVPVPEITVEPLNKNVYLYGTVIETQLLKGAKAYVSDDPGKKNIIGDLLPDAEGWRVEYVTVAVKGYFGGAAPTFFTGDTVYNFNVEVTPKNPNGTVQSGGGANALNIFVYKPKVTFKDLEVYYGGEANLGDAVEKTEWFHGNQSSADSDITMTGNAPTIDFTYSVVDGETVTSPAAVQIPSPEDKYVKVTEAKIGENVLTVDSDITYAHKPCDPDCGYDATKGRFMLHVKTCTLKITKDFEGEPHSVDKSFLFTIKSDANNSVKIDDLSVMLHYGTDNAGSVTIEGLPVGTYTVTEDSVMAWRYKVTAVDETAQTDNSVNVTLGEDQTSVTVAFKNKITKTQWITFADFRDNLFGAAPVN